MSYEFYQKILPFSEFKDISQDEYFHDMPENWSVIITDIRGSTKAVQEGRYRDVNMLGASSIMAIMNAIKQYDFPYVFGGDGATILVPNSELENLRPLFLGLKHLAQNQFRLELRVGIVPISDLYRQQARLQVAKYAVADGNHIAIFRGGGLSVAEKWIKHQGPHGEKYTIDDSSDAPVPLDGLSCRWQPIVNERGYILTLVAQVTEAHYNNENKILKALLLELESGLKNPLSFYNPIKRKNMKQKPSDLGLRRELSLYLNSRQNKLRATFEFFFWLIFQTLMIRMGWKVEAWDAAAYTDAIPRHADYKKYDDTLRLVLDVSNEEGKVIEETLKDYHAKGIIHYGLAKSNDALMTCMVFSATKSQHLHFVDGGAGGYTAAATQMKGQKSLL